MAKKTKTPQSRRQPKKPTQRTVLKVADLVVDNKKPKAKAPKIEVKDRAKKGSKIDWSPVRTKYITDPKATFRSIAEEFDISRSSVGIMSKKEGWTLKRQEYVKKTEHNVIAKSSEERAQQIRDLKETHANMFSGIKAKLVTAVNDLDVDEWAAKNLEHLSKAAKHVMEAERLTIGLPSDVKGISDPEGDRFTVTMEQLHQKAEDALNEED